MLSQTRGARNDAPIPASQERKHIAQRMLNQKSKEATVRSIGHVSNESASRASTRQFEHANLADQMQPT